MKIHLLGTGAADGIPSYYSDSRVSNYARQHGGKDVRTRSAAIIDGHLKIDMGPDTFHQLQSAGLTIRDWSALLFTHSDDDHFAPRELQYCLYPFCPEEYLGFPIYANAHICDRYREEYPEWPIELVETHSFQTFSHGEYQITPVKAFHKLSEDSQNHLIQHEGKTLFYATDTGIWREDTWAFLEGWKVDAMVLECTEGTAPTDYPEHLDVAECKEVVGRLRQMKVLGPDSRVVTTHHAHYGDCTHAELEAVLNPFGIEVGYDGMQFEI